MAPLVKQWLYLANLPSALRRRTSGLLYRPEIDGLRFFAIAIVVVGHFSQRSARFFPQTQEWIDGTSLGQLLSNPGTGVHLFFTISGFIIATQAIKAMDSLLSTRYLLDYFVRRIIRIEPPYIILLFATYFLITTTGFRPAMTNYFDTEPASLTWSLFGSILYVHNLAWGTFPRLFPPGWTLEVEVQFYLSAPLLCWAYLKVPNGLIKVTSGLMILAIASLLAALIKEDTLYHRINYSLLCFFDYFFLGIMLAKGSVWINEKIELFPDAVASALGWVGLIAFILLSAPWLNGGWNLATRPLSLLAIAAMFASAWAQRSSFRAFCRLPWISLIGGACYSIYLIHLQLIQLMTSLIAKMAATFPPLAVCVIGFLEFAIILVAGLGFYAMVERPFMTPNWPKLVWRLVGERFLSMGERTS